jgi:FG-GAP-like repeat
MEDRTLLSAITVTNTLDDGSVGSLRWAVGQANAGGGAETIKFDPSLFNTPQTITLTQGQLELSDPTGTETITGPAVGVTVSGGGQSRVFQVDKGVTASISGVTITAGSVGRNGGGLYNLGTAALTNCTITGNSAGYGGGLSDYFGTATLTNCTVSGNSAHSGGGGVSALGATITLTNCTISGNSAGSGSGGVGVYASAITLTNCTVSGNSALGTSTSYSGGGLYIGGNPSFTTAMLTNCTVSGNTAANGGGLDIRIKPSVGSTAATLTNCTVSGNIGTSAQSGSVAGVYVYSGNTMFINTIVAGNTNVAGASDIGGPGTVSGSNNLIGNGGSGGLASGVDGNLVGVANPGLGPLADNGGPTQTMALLPGSPALRAGTAVSGLTTDQRGQPADLPSPDIGAYQDGPVPFIVATAGGQLQGWLDGLPETTYRIDVFASSAYNADGSGEEQDFLGSLMVTTDAAGRVSFAIPFAVPAGLPAITATATDTQGETGNVSALRAAVFQVPTGDLRNVPGQPVIFSSAGGDALAVQDPDAGPLDPVWSLTLSVGAGTLLLSSTAGLTGSGDGTGSLSYSGPLSAINAALEGLALTPVPGSSGATTLSLDAESVGARSTQAQVLIVYGLDVVTTTADSGPGSLRQAILDANAFIGPANTIDFAIPGFGVQTIAPLSSLPAISSQVLIDGESQPGYSGSPLMAIDGSQAGGGDGLTITGWGVSVRGLDITNFSNGAGIHLTGTGATGAWIYGDFLGTDPTGTKAMPNRVGVEIDGGASNDLIGTNGDGVNDAAERNLISGNAFADIWINGQGTEDNAVAGNLIAASITGDVALDSGTSPVYYQGLGYLGWGVLIQGGASDNRIGTDGNSVDDVGERNLISGSASAGIVIAGSGTDGNIVAGNLIGTDLTGTRALGNAGPGVALGLGASLNWIGVNPKGGTALADEGNVISDNAFGVIIEGGTEPGTNANVIAGNKIGTDITGTEALGNKDFGVWVIADFGSVASNTIGGTTAGTANVISANGLLGFQGFGVEFLYSAVSDNVVEGNLIGTDITGSRALGNAAGGVFIEDGGSGITIGGATAAAGNLIANNGGPGVTVGSSPSDLCIGNQITANRIFGNTGPAIDLGSGPGVIDNGPAPRLGPNNLQNFPVFVRTDYGQIEGTLAGSLPDTTFRIDVYASAAYGPGGSGAAQVYLGSLSATTDASGQVSFAVPFTAPEGLPILTATATDPQGNTSELSTLRHGSLQVPSGSVRAVPNQSLAIATQAGGGIAIEDPNAAANAVWDLTLAVSDGTLTMPSTAGLTGSGDGTGSLSYSGPLAALNAAIQGLIFHPPAGAHVFATVAALAQSYDAQSLQAQFAITDGVFVVDTTADSGPGSLRQAILDADSTTGLLVTIDFAIPGAGVQTIDPLTPLPAIAASALIDGTTQPGFAGTPLIAVDAAPGGGPAALTIAGAGVTVAGLAVDQFAFVTTTNLVLVAQVHPQALTTQLSLLDSQGHVLVQSDGLSPSDPDDLAAEQLGSGSYFLKVASTGGAGSYTLTTTVAPTTAAFQPPAVGQGPDAIVAGAFTGNGRTDLAVANISDNTVSVLLSNGDGTFQPQATYAVGADPDAIVAGDFTGNGILDLAVANSYYGGPGSGLPTVRGTVSVLLGNGDGTFQPQVTYAVGTDPVTIVAGDFRGNGRTDLAVSDGNGIEVLLNNGDGTFQPARTVAVGVNGDGVGGVGRDLVAGDFTGDGRTDLAVASNSHNPDVVGEQGIVSVLIANGDGTFQPPVTYTMDVEGGSPAPSCMVAGDFSGDGRLDLALVDNISVTNPDGTHGAPNELLVLLGNGDGTFQSPVSTALGQLPIAMATGDFTGDGHLDLAAVSTSGGVSVLLGNGDGTFRPQATYAAGPYSIAVATGDLTGDGRLDLAVANEFGNDVSVMLNNGDGTFAPLNGTPNAVGPNPNAIVAGDFTGDGRLDLAVANLTSDDVSVLLSNGDGTFQPQVTYAVGSFPMGIVAGDFNGDGRLDLAVVNKYSDNVSVLLGNGDGTFQPQVTYAVGGTNDSFPLAIVAGDFTGDGILDLAVANWNLYATSTVGVLLGNGDGTFKPQVTYAVGNEPDAIVAGDLTGDGVLDLAVANDNSYGPGTVSVLLGKGDGTFKPQVTYAVGADPNAIVAGDFSGDGRIDLAVANGGNGTVSVLLGKGDGTFAPQVTYAVGGYPGGIVAGDFTGDGHLDLALVNGSGYTGAPGSVSVLLGTGDGTFADAGQFVTTPYATPLVADVTGNGTADVLVVDGSGNIVYRQAIPGQPGSFLPPVTIDRGNPSRDIAWLPKSDQGPVLASVDAHDDAISFYAYRDGHFVRLDGSFATGQLPAQIIAAQLSGDGLTDLVVRNAGDGSVSVYYATTLSNIGFIGPVSSFMAPNFLSPVTFAIRTGVSDVRAVDASGSGLLDLVVTNKLTGQVSVLLNQDNVTFAAAIPYRAATGLSAIDASSTPEVTSLDATVGVTAGSFTTGGPPDLVTINPGSDSLDVLAGLGGGRFANPVAILTPGPAQVVRVADFTDNGIPDLAVLTSTGVSIYLGNGKGGFLPPVTYNAGVDPTGLTVADILGNGKLDLLVGNVYGDVLILVGNGDGTFRPFEPVKDAVALAVADLTGNGVPDFVFADQSLNRVSVVYGTTSQEANSPAVIGNQTTGVLAPGAILLKDLNSDGIPDLIVANSGGNNVLVYPGLGDGQFGPPVGGTKGFPVGTDPTGLAVADLPDSSSPDHKPVRALLVADTGSNDVSVLLGQGSGSSWTMIPGARVHTDAGPVALVVGDLLGGTQPDLAVANSGANNVQVFPGVGSGFFNDQPQAITAIPVGQAPSSLFLGNFNGFGQGLATLNSGSNNGTLITGLGLANPVTQTFPTGGNSPTAGFAGEFTNDGFTDLVVGNNGDGQLALLIGGPGGLSLSQTFSSAAVPNPTALSFGGVSDGLLSFYVSTAGHEAATSLAFNLNGGPESEGGVTSVVVTPTEGSSAGVLSQATSGSVQQVSQLLSLSGTTLDLAATLLTVSVVELESGGSTSPTGSSTGPGQGQGSSHANGSSSGSGDEPSDEATQGDEAAQAIVERATAWERLVIGLERSWERARAVILELDIRSPAAESRKATAPPAAGRKLAPPVPAPARPTTKDRTGAQAQPVSPSDAAMVASRLSVGASSIPRPEGTGPAVDAALAGLDARREADGPASGYWDELANAQHTDKTRALVALVASAAVVGTGWTLGRREIRRRRSVSIHLH